MANSKKENGESTRRAIIVTSERTLTPDAFIEQVNGNTNWKASRSKHHDVVIRKGCVEVEFRSLGDHALKSVNVSPQDGEHRHIPIDQDVLSELAPVLESLNTTVGWVLADDDKIKTSK